jgi:hypothetical protein
MSVENVRTEDNPEFEFSWGQVSVGLSRNCPPGWRKDIEKHLCFRVRDSVNSRGIVVGVTAEQMQELFQAYVQIMRAYEEHP